MEITALAIAVIALGAAALAWVRAGAVRLEAEDKSAAARRQATNAVEALAREVGVLRALLARSVGGGRVTAEMVHEGQLWRDVQPAEAQGLIAAGTCTVIDVRTTAETASGVIPGAKHIPMDELEEREGEVPRSGTVLVYCAGGGRSAAVCEALAQRGFETLVNLAGGIGAWNGPLERPR